MIPLALALALALALPAGSVAAGSGSASPSGGGSPSHALAHFDAGEGTSFDGTIALIADPTGPDGRLFVVARGLSASAAYRVVVSGQDCGGDRPGAPRLRFDDIDGGRAVTKLSARRPVVDLVPFLEAHQATLSLWLIQTSPTRASDDCRPAILYAKGDVPTAAGVAPAFDLGDLAFTAFGPDDRARGVIVVRPAADSVSFEGLEVRLASGRHRLIGSRVPCGSPHTPADAVFRRGFQAKPAGNSFAFGFATATPPTLSLASVRFFAGRTGFSQPEGCSGIIAILIGL